MRQFWGSTYGKNLWCLQEAADELLSHMKGYDYSFRRDITDERGDFSQEKLLGLVDGMTSLWENELRSGRDLNPATGESVAEPFLRARLGLYRTYLYLGMRCSLCQGAYSNARGGSEVKERTDFAFLLEQAKQLTQAWCVLAEPDGTRRNEPYWGYDMYFGFHLYRPFREFAAGGGGVDQSLTPIWKRAVDQPTHLMTDEGNTKPVSIQRLNEGSQARPQAEEQALTAEEDYDAGDEDYDDLPWNDCDPEDYDEILELWREVPELQTAELERNSELGSMELGLRFLWQDFQCEPEYLAACENFKELFGQAAPEVLRDFQQDLEEIVDLYLKSREIPPLLDTDKTLNVYNRLCDGALRQAKRYGRGIQWKGL